MKFLGQNSVSSYLQVVLIGILAVLILVLLANLFILLKYFVLNSDMFPWRLSNTGISGISGTARITAKFPVSQGFFILFWSLVYIFQIMSAYIIYLMIRLLVFFRNNNPFNHQVVLYIKRIGLTTLVISAFQVLAETGYKIYFDYIVKVKDCRIEFGPGLSGIFFGLIILVIAHVFLEATKIKEEQSLTI